MWHTSVPPGSIADTADKACDVQSIFRPPVDTGSSRNSRICPGRTQCSLTSCCTFCSPLPFEKRHNTLTEWWNLLNIWHSSTKSIVIAWLILISTTVGPFYVFVANNLQMWQRVGHVIIPPTNCNAGLNVMLSLAFVQKPHLECRTVAHTVEQVQYEQLLEALWASYKSANFT